MTLPPRVGVFGIGLGAYWEQFAGLRERLVGYQETIEERLRGLGADVRSGGLVDTSLGARKVADDFGSANLDLVFVYAATYATSSQVVPVVQATRGLAVILNLQPVAQLDYENVTTAEWLANCTACCVPELAGAFTRCGIPYDTITGTLDGEAAWRRIADWIAAARAARSVRRSRIGFLGHTYPGMLDMYTDFTRVHGQIGGHVEVLEIDDLVARVRAATAPDVESKKELIREVFDFADPGADPIAAPISDDAFDWSARVAVGLDALVADFELDGLTYYYRGLGGNDAELLAAGMIVGNSLLTARGVPAAGEGDLKTCVAMMILDRLRAGGSFTEFYAFDFADPFILMGHDGPGHIAISNIKPVVRALRLYHGKAGHGLSVEFRVKPGPVTILGMTEDAFGRLRLLCAEGESILGPTFQIGNTNSRLRFALEPAEFMDAWCAHGPTHHVALGTGHQAGRLAKVAELLGLELVRVS